VTGHLLPDVISNVSPQRRGRGAGEPAAHPVPPPEGPASHHAPFRIGAAGLVVVIVPDRLQAACAVRGWSLAQLARRAGISYPTLKSTLRGSPIRPRTAWKLANALGEGTEAIELHTIVEAS
jgi:lambda repressor-like predicted transcriptional regulator